MEDEEIKKHQDKIQKRILNGSMSDKIIDAIMGVLSIVIIVMMCIVVIVVTPFILISGAVILIIGMAIYLPFLLFVEIRKELGEK